MHPPLKTAKIACQLTAEANQMGVPFASVIGSGPQPLPSYLTPSNFLCMLQPSKILLWSYMYCRHNSRILQRHCDNHCGPQRDSRISEPSLPSTLFNDHQLPLRHLTKAQQGSYCSINHCTHLHLPRYGLHTLDAHKMRRSLYIWSLDR